MESPSLNLTVLGRCVWRIPLGTWQVFKLLVVDNTSLNWVFAEGYLVKQNLRVKDPSEVPEGCGLSHFWEHCLAWLHGGRDRRVI